MAICFSCALPSGEGCTLAFLFFDVLVVAASKALHCGADFGFLPLFGGVACTGRLESTLAELVSVVAASLSGMLAEFRSEAASSSSINALSDDASLMQNFFVAFLLIFFRFVSFFFEFFFYFYVIFLLCDYYARFSIIWLVFFQVVSRNAALYAEKKKFRNSFFLRVFSTF